MEDLKYVLTIDQVTPYYFIIYKILGHYFI